MGDPEDAPCCLCLVLLHGVDSIGLSSGSDIWPEAVTTKPPMSRGVKADGDGCALHKGLLVATGLPSHNACDTHTACHPSQSAAARGIVLGPHSPVPSRCSEPTGPRFGGGAQRACRPGTELTTALPSEGQWCSRGLACARGPVCRRGPSQQRQPLMLGVFTWAEGLAVASRLLC